MLKFFLSLSLLLLSFQEQCHKYSCIENSSENQGKCMIFYENETQVKKCPYGQSCNFYDTLVVKKCVNNKKKDQESCSKGDECFSKNCTGNICQGKKVGEECYHHLECAKNLYCDGKCENFLKKGDKCTKDIQCPFGFGCGKSNQENSEQICIKLYSIDSGQYSSKALLCKSGYLYGNNSLCATSRAENEGHSCNTNEECELKIKFGEGSSEIDGLGECKCAWKDSKTYCEFSTSYSEYSEYVERLSNYYQSKTINEDDYIAELKTHLPHEIKLLQLKGSIQYQNIETCLEDFLQGFSLIKKYYVTFIFILLF